MSEKREKLIELLTAALCNQSVEEVADYLLANGVTVQKWIPVTERLPERGEAVLCYMNFSNHPELGFPSILITDNVYDGILVGSRPRKHIWGWQGDFVTYWMPLPELPREGEDGSNGTVEDRITQTFMGDSFE